MSFALRIAELILALCSFGVVIGFLISTGKVLKEFKCLNSDVQNKLLLLDYYMIVVRNFSKDDLIKISKLSDEEIKFFNTIPLYNERIKKIKEKINMGKQPWM